MHACSVVDAKSLPLRAKLRIYRAHVALKVVEFSIDVHFLDATDVLWVEYADGMHYTAFNSSQV